MGFDAYGATSDAPDPVAHAINCMLDHMHVIDKKMIMMCEKMQEMGIEQDMTDFHEMDSCEINSTAEELLKLKDKADE